MRYLVVIFTFLIIDLGYGQHSIKELDKHFQKSLEIWNVPGMSIGIIKDGKVVLAKGYGVKEAGGNEKVDKETMYAIASNTKAFTTGALATLVESKKISWTDEVRKYLPGFSVHGQYESENLTIRDLLCHRVGYGNYSGDVMWYKSERSATELLDRIQYVPKAFEFRDGYGYSNLMYITAGEVIRSVTGMKWNEYVTKTFFKPLKMDRSVTTITNLGDYENVATPHKSLSGENAKIPWANWDNMGSAGSVISCVDDMLKWISLHLNHGTIDGDQYFTQKTQEELWHPRNNYRVDHNTRGIYPRNFAGYGLGWSMYDHEGYKVITHGGAYDGMYSRVAMVPDQNLGIVILTNSMTSIHSSLTYEILDHYTNGSDTDWNKWGLERQASYLNRMEGKKQKIKDKRQLDTSPTVGEEDMTGSYYDHLYGANISVVSSSDGSLSLHFDKAPGLDAKLSHWHYDTFEIQWKQTHAWFDFGTLQFLTDNNNKVIGLEFDVPNGDIFFHEIHAKKIQD